MDALQPALDGHIMLGQDQLEFKLDGASWIEGGQLWVLELEPDESFLPGTIELEEPQSATTVEIAYSSAHSKQTPETGLAVQEYQHESDKIKSRAPGHLQTEGTLIGNGEAFRQSPKRRAHQRSRPEKLLRCDQCEKAFRYPSDLARHLSRGHKAAKQNRSQSETGSPTPLESMVLALQRENTFTKSGKAFHQNSKAVTGQNAPPRKLLFCDQCGKAFRYPSHVARHQSVHARQKTAKGAQSASEIDNSSPRELTPLATGVENNSINHSKAPSHNSNLTTKQNRDRRRRYFCNQCGKAFRYTSDITRHQRVHSRHKAAERSRSQSEGDRSSLSESPLLELRRENAFTKSGNAFHQNSKAVTGQNAPPRKLLFCDQCGKAFRYPSHVARHQSVHVRQKTAKGAQSASEIDNSSPRELTPLATGVENNSINHSKAPSQNSNVTTKQNRDRRRRYFCNQCGKAFRYTSDITRHQRVHSRHKAAERSRSQSEGDRSSLSESPLLALRRENAFTKSGNAFHQNSKAVTGQNAPPRKLLFCDQCGKAFRYPSHVARHQSVHVRQKTAKGAQSASEIDNSSPRELTPLATPVENNSSETLSENSVATSKRSLRHRKRRFCNQCGEACSPELSQHHSAHSRQKAAKRVPSEAEDCSPLDLTSLIKLLENISLSSSRALHQNSKGTTHQSSRCGRRCFSVPCGDPCCHLSDLHAISEQKAAKPGQSQSEASSPSSAVQAENAFANSSQTLAKKAKTAAEHSIHRKREIFCEQCGKAFRYPSDLARHQAVHSRQKGNLSPWEADSPTSLGPTPVEPRAESTLTNSSRARHRNSEVTTDQHFRGSELHFCTPCDKVFRYRSDLTRHKRVHSKRKAAVPLPKVLQKENAAATVSKASSPSSPWATARNAPATKPYLCDQCGEGFWWRSELSQHEYSHFHERPYYCSICGRQFRRRVQLVKHQRWHEDSQEGEGKGATFQNVDLDSGVGRYLPREVLQALPPEKTGEPCGMFVSPERSEAGACEAGGRDISELHPANSIWEIGISGQPYLLPLPRAGERGCDETDGEGGSSTWSPGPSLQVEDASSTILEPAASSSEISTATASPGAYGHIASEPKGKISTANVSIDRVAWLPQKSGPDPECSPSPNRPRQLRERSRSSVQRAKPHSCPICSQRFKRASYLTKHLNVHRPGKPHSCTFCEKTFGRRSYLLKHLKIHCAVVPHPPGMHSARVPKVKPSTASVTVGRPPRISSPDPEWLPSQQRPRQPRKRDRSCAQGAEPHACPICSKRFKFADYLMKHLNIHRPGTLHNCTLCEKEFSQRPYMLKHLRKVHGVVQVHT